MKSRPSSLVIVLLSAATLIGFTSALRSDDLRGVGTGNLGIGTELDTTTPGISPDITDSAGPRGTGSTATGSGSAGPGEADPSVDLPQSDSGGIPADREGAPDTSPIRIAYLIPDLAGVGAVFGGDPTGGGSDGDADRGDSEFRALVDHVNAAGGIRGRPIEARGYRFTIDEQADNATLLQRCVEITEDYGAQYVIDTHIMLAPEHQQCFAQRGVVLVTLASAQSEQLLAQLRPYIATTYPTIDRTFAALVPKLSEVGYLKGARIGVFLDGSPHVEGPFADTLEPALAAAGVKPVAVARARSGDAAAHGNAVLRFRSAGATHVIFIGNILNIAAFTNAAEAQGYRPRYAFTDYYTSHESAAAIGTPGQLKNAVAVSSCDYIGCINENADRTPSDDSTPYERSELTPGLQRCFDTLSQARNTNYYRPAERGASNAHSLICDHFFLWLDALNAGAEIHPSTFGEAVRALGTSYASPRVHATNFGDGRQSGATHFAAGVYNDRCTCWVRQTTWTAAP